MERKRWLEDIMNTDNVDNEKNIVMIPSRYRNKSLNEILDFVFYNIWGAQSIPEIYSEGSRKKNIPLFDFTVPDKIIDKISYSWDDYLYAHDISYYGGNGTHYKGLRLLEYKALNKKTNNYQKILIDDAYFFQKTLGEPLTSLRKCGKGELSLIDFIEKTYPLTNDEKQSEYLEFRKRLNLKGVTSWYEEMFDFFLKSKFYYELDILYLLKVYSEYIKSKYKKVDLENPTKDMKKTVISVIDAWPNGPESAMVKEEDCYSSIFFDFINDINIKNDTIEIFNSAWYEMKIFMLTNNKSRKLFIKMPEKRVDGYRKKDIVDLKEKADLDFGISNKEMEEYWFEVLTGDKLCTEESYYYGKIIEAVKTPAYKNTARGLLLDIFKCFNTLPNICSRVIFARECLEVICIFEDNEQDIIKYLQELKGCLPVFVRQVTLLMEFTEYSIWRLYSNFEKSLNDRLKEYNLLKEWNKQVQLKNIDSHERYRQCSKLYIRNDRIELNN